MKPTRPGIDVEALIREIQRYLAFVDAVRATGNSIRRRERRKKEEG